MKPAPASTQPPTCVVCLVLQDSDGTILVTQRPGHKQLGLLWEFPGGKVELGEDPESALRREIEEELCFAVGDLAPLPCVKHSYDFGQIELLPYLSVCMARPSLRMTEHVAFRWIALSDWESLSWAPADIPVIKYLHNQKNAL